MHLLHGSVMLKYKTNLVPDVWRSPVLVALFFSLLYIRIANAAEDPASGLPAADRPLTAMIRSHFDFMIDAGRDTYGPLQTEMWLATMDVESGGLPAQPIPNSRRWYRKITSPRGSNLYWDQPLILAAHRLSEVTSDPQYADRADAYMRQFLEQCVAHESGLFQWGNHIYYDVVEDQVSSFSGGYHECRPHTPAWDLFWRIDAAKTGRAIRALGLAHIKDKKSGLFCRHANPNAPAGEFQAGEVSGAKPFLEAGAVLIDSLCWLAQQTDSRQGPLAESALRVARYSFAQRHPQTGLMRNQPIDKRWDYFASTTEIGLWAGSLVRAAESTGKGEFEQIAEAALHPWLRHGFDEAAQKFYGRLAVESGLPQTPEEPRGWIPPMYAEVFDIHERPTHNYPMPMAEVCLSLYERTRSEIYLTAVERWVAHIENSLPANDGEGAYAEDYGRVIHFLTRASQSLNRPAYKDLAWRIADEAVEKLYLTEPGAFRSHPGEDRCDAVDGPGFLFLALLYLESGEQAEVAQRMF